MAAAVAGKGRNGDVDGTSDSPAALAQAAAESQTSIEAKKLLQLGTTKKYNKLSPNYQVLN